MELRGSQIRQPRRKNANGKVLQITPIYFEIWISILFLTRASQFTDKCPELYLEE